MKRLFLLGLFFIGSLGVQSQNLINSTDDVGIGTTSPSEKLEVSGLIRIPIANATENNSPGIVTVSNDDFLYDNLYLNHYGFGFHKYQDNSSPLYGRNSYVSGFFGIDFFTGGINRLRINYDGSIGMGTNTPESKLHVKSGDSGGNPHIISMLTVENDDYAMISVLTPNDKFGCVGFADEDDTWVAGLRYEHSNDQLIVYSNNINQMYVNANGSIGIGTADTGTHKLAVEGAIGAREIKVEGFPTWSDYVFFDDYKLPSLTEVENHIKVNGHLKNIPSATEVAKDGFYLGEMDAKLLQKIEELTLYTIEQDKKIKELEKLKLLVEKIQADLESLK